MENYIYINYDGEHKFTSLEDLKELAYSIANLEYDNDNLDYDYTEIEIEAVVFDGKEYDEKQLNVLTDKLHSYCEIAFDEMEKREKEDYEDWNYKQSLIKRRV